MQGQKSMTLEDLAMYLKDLIRMGFVTVHIDENGKQRYRLTKFGKKSGLDLINLR